jgi:hypothetical protein
VSSDRTLSYAALEERVAELERRLEHAGPTSQVPRRRPRRLAFAAVIAAAAMLVPGLAIASHQFADVPDANPYHGDISVLATSGVTTGCGGGTFCPTDNVTREQMAAFMNRLGALGSGLPPVVNADRLDGYHANGLARVTSTSTSVASPVLTMAETVYHTVTIEAPTHGYVLVQGALTIRELACLTNCTISARLRHVESGANSIAAEAWVKERATIALNNVFAVAPGSNSFHTRIHRVAVGDGNVNGWFNQMSALFVPFNASGSPPTF